MEWINVAVVLAVIYLFSSIKRRNRNRRPPEDLPRMPEERRDRWPEGGSPDSTGSSGSADASPAGGYDYKAFRKKLRTAWKLPETEQAETEVVFREVPPEPPVVEQPWQPAPTPAPVRETPIDTAELARQRQMQEYAARLAAKTEPGALPALAATAPAVPAGPQSATSWSEDAVRQWMIYDAVLGEPRSRQTWRPRYGRRRD